MKTLLRTCPLFFMLCILASVLQAQDIYTAVREGDVASVKVFLAEDPSLLNRRNTDLLTPLNLAAEQNRVEVAAALLEMGADPTIGDRENSQPIHLAAVSGSIGIIGLLLDKKVDIDAKDINGMTPLLFASSRGQTEAVRYLVERGADVKAKTANGITAFHMATISGNIELMAFLLDHGAQVNTRTLQGHTPLHSACSYGRTDAVKFLAEHGADMEAKTDQGEPPLFWAVGRNSLGAAEYLVAHGADVNFRTPDGFTALHQAAGRGNTEVGRLLLEHGANVNAAANTGLVPLANAAWSENAAEMGRMLILYGAGVNPEPCLDNRSCTCGPNFLTPLHAACMMGRAELAEVLVENGAKVNLFDSDGITPLYFAVKKGDANLVKYLLDHGAFVNVQQPGLGCTELHMAASMGYSDVAEILLMTGSSPLLTDHDGKTPVDAAFYYGQDKIGYRFLAQTGGSPEGDLAEAEAETCRPGEAKIWFLGHSGWAIETAHHFLVFDYFDDPRSRKPDHPCLASGCINPDELGGKKLSVFCSHDHQDHYSPSIFGWSEDLAVNYYFCFTPAGQTGPYTYLPVHSDTVVEDMEIYVSSSTDAGGGYLVEADGIVIYFMGDHANGEDHLMPEFTQEIDRIAEMGKDIDLVFGPIRGCSLGTPAQVKAGTYYMVDKLRPHLFIPMHSGNYSLEYKAFVDQARTDGIKQEMKYFSGKGDRFTYTSPDVLGDNALHP